MWRERLSELDNYCNKMKFSSCEGEEEGGGENTLNKNDVFNSSNLDIIM